MKLSLLNKGGGLSPNPNPLWPELLKLNTSHTATFFKLNKGPRRILKKGCFGIVGNGHNIKIWEDRWINPQAGNSTWTPKPDNTLLLLLSLT
jgi:hypothetical protein